MIERGNDGRRERVCVVEVQRALSAFNTMQGRIRGFMAERTQILAAVTHDLKTPMTRMRLRLEHCADAALKEKICADLAAMQALADLTRHFQQRGVRVLLCEANARINDKLANFGLLERLGQRDATVSLPDVLAQASAEQTQTA